MKRSGEDIASILLDFFGDCDLAWDRYIRSSLILAIPMFILVFAGMALHSVYLQWASNAILIAIVFLLGCFFADLKETPWSPAVEMMLVFVLGLFAVFFGSLAIGILQHGLSAFLYIRSFQATAFFSFLPLPIGFAVRKLTQFIRPAKTDQSDEQLDSEDGPEISPI